MDGMTLCEREARGERAQSRLIETWGRRYGLAGMEVSRGRSVERSRCAGSRFRLPAWFVAWLSNDVPAHRASPRRGSKEARTPGQGFLESGIPAAGLSAPGRRSRSWQE